MSEYRGDVVGWGPWRRTWFSVCSRHLHGCRECRMCLTGHYINDWAHAADNVVYRRAGRLWLWWHNRPGSASRRHLAHLFPGLSR